jgi:hypothetical protein
MSVIPDSNHTSHQRATNPGAEPPEEVLWEIAPIHDIEMHLDHSTPVLENLNYKFIEMIEGFSSR